MLKLLNSSKTKLVEGRRIINDDGTPTAYVVTEEGEIWSDETNDFRKIQISKNTGYPIVSLSLNGQYKCYTVHRIVAKYYLSNEYNYECVNHKDCDKTNNNWRNLEWCTHEYNSQYIHENEYNNPKDNYAKKLPDSTIEEICQMIDDGFKSIEIAKKFGLNKSYIANIKMGSTHRKISSKYKFSEHFKHKYENFAKVGNEGNHYIPPLKDEDEPKYIKIHDEINIRKLCEYLSSPNYVSSKIAANEFHMSEKMINKIRTGELFPEIVKDYKINNDKSTSKRISIQSDPDLIDKILTMASDGNHTINGIGRELKLTDTTIRSVIFGDFYAPYRNHYDINLKDVGKGRPLTDDIKMKAINLLKLNQYTRQEIADKVGISLASVVKIKRIGKKLGLL